MHCVVVSLCRCVVVLSGEHYSMVFSVGKKDTRYTYHLIQSQCFFLSFVEPYFLWSTYSYPTNFIVLNAMVAFVFLCGLAIIADY